MDRRERAQRDEEVLARTLKQIPRRLHSLYLTFADPATERPSAIQIWTLKCLGAMGGSLSEDDDSYCECCSSSEGSASEVEGCTDEESH